MPAQNFRLGLVSISFRPLSPAQIIEKCVAAQLEGIEWGGDVHVPHGDIQTAREVARQTRDAGLEIPTYGSYYRCDHDGEFPFQAALDCALELRAPCVRVWAGKTDAKDAKIADFVRVAADLERICDLSSAHGVQIVTEFHGGTLTATGADALDLLRMAPRAKTLWQPLRRAPGFAPQIEENLAELELVAPFLSHVHVYEWGDDEAGNRRMFSLEESAQWPFYVQKLREIGEQNRWLLLEYVPENDPEVLAREADALRGILSF